MINGPSLEVQDRVSEEVGPHKLARQVLLGFSPNVSHFVAHRIPQAFFSNFKR
jgi:hypothetical protein